MTRLAPLVLALLLATGCSLNGNRNRPPPTPPPTQQIDDGPRTTASDALGLDPWEE